MKQVKVSLKDYFGEDPGFEVALKSFSANFKEHLTYEVDYKLGDFRLISNRMNPSEKCRMKLFISEHLLFVVLFVFFEMVILYLIIREFRSIKHRFLAETLYKCIYLEICKNSKVFFAI